MLNPEQRACLEVARRIVCGDRGDIFVDDEGWIHNGASFQLEPSRDQTDALIVAISQAMQLHLGGVDFGKLRHDFITAGMREELADMVHDHLLEFSVEDWVQVRTRVDFYVHDNARVAAFDTAKSGTT